MSEHRDEEQTRSEGDHEGRDAATAAIDDPVSASGVEAGDGGDEGPGSKTAAGAEGGDAGVPEAVVDQEIGIIEGLEGQIEVLKSELAATQKDLDASQKRAREAEEAKLRMAADFDNFRKRQARDVARMQDERTEKILRQVLPVFDALARALAQVDRDQSATGVKEGLTMILQMSDGFLAGMGVSKIEAAGRKFDPNVHEALVRVPVPEGGVEDSVAEVFEDGYMLGDRVLRPSKVSVAKNDG